MSHSTQTGRFDQSFVFHMIRDFFLLLIVVTGIELGVRFAVVLYEFDHHDKELVGVTAERLASDLHSIMLNSGGPVAARTIFPILERNYQARGMTIAIVPSRVTVTSIESMFNFTPRGISPEWPAGKHNEARIPLVAEKFCLNCHLHAKAGDELGHVTVRNNLATKIDIWWGEVRLSGLLWAINIITHTVVLFMLLKIRMEPLLSLRSTVSSLAKGVIDLSHRATVKTHDEFGELAQDMNHFLDRITQVVEDLHKVLTTVVAVSHRLDQVSGQMNRQFQSMHTHMQNAARRTVGMQIENPAFSQTGFEAADAVVSLFEALGADPGIAPQTGAKLRDVSQRFQALVGQARSLLQGSAELSDALIGLSGEAHEFNHFLSEMAVLEEKMKVVAQSGEILLDRLQTTHARPGAAG